MAHRGFSTLEIMIAFAVMSLVFGGVMLADFSSNYWVIASQTSNEGLYKAKTLLEELRALSKQDFYAASSTAVKIDMDASCAAGSLCYFVESKVTDISTCSKYVQAVSSWAVRGYPTTTTSLPTHLTSPAEAIALGGDCLLNPPAGHWTGMVASSTATISGTPTSVDTLGGTTYISSTASPYLATYHYGLVSYTNGFAVSDPINAIDVARDEATGRNYAYLALASTTGQLAVVDVTDPTTPIEVARVALGGVDPLGSYPQGWRVVYYSQRVYVVSRETTGPEFHVFNVANPAIPVELGSFEINTSAYDMVVRDEKAGNAVHRFAYLATTKGSAGTLVILDVTDPSLISEVVGARTMLAANGKSITLSGHTVLVGTDNVSSGPELYQFDASALLAVSGGLPVLGSAEVGSAIIGLDAIGGNVFGLSSTQAGPTISRQLDVDGNDVYVVKNTGKEIRVWSLPLQNTSLLSTQSIGSAALQLYESN